MYKYSIQIHKHVEKFLDKHPEIRARFFSSAHIMQVNPLDSTLDITTLSGAGSDHYRLRIGKYRFLFEIVDSEVLVYFYDAGSRGDIYK